MILPNRIFFTGVPGSKWSGIARTIERIPGFDLSDHTSDREYIRENLNVHAGVYFGKGMEFEPILDAQYIDSAWHTHTGTKLVKSHDWSYKLKDIHCVFPNDWIMLVHRPDHNSFEWWKAAGGFNISYPDYSSYINYDTMLKSIIEQNTHIIEFASLNNATWDLFTSAWIEKNFGHGIEPINRYVDILVTLIKG